MLEITAMVERGVVTQARGTAPGTEIDTDVVAGPREISGSDREPATNAEADFFADRKSVATDANLQPAAEDIVSAETDADRESTWVA